METEGHPEMQRDAEVQNDETRSPPNERMAEEPEGIPTAPPQVQVPPESPDEDSEDDPETAPRRSPLNPAASRQRFRQFRHEDAAGPRDVPRHLQEPAGQWPRPDTHTKEQTVEMLAQEQLQAVLPEELRAWALRCQPGVRITGQNPTAAPSAHI